MKIQVSRDEQVYGEGKRVIDELIDMIVEINLEINRFTGRDKDT